MLERFEEDFTALENTRRRKIKDEISVVAKDLLMKEDLSECLKQLKDHCKVLKQYAVEEVEEKIKFDAFKRLPLVLKYINQDFRDFLYNRFK